LLPEGVLNQRQNERSEGEVARRRAQRVSEGVLNQRQNERSEAEWGGSAGYACGGGAEPQ